MISKRILYFGADCTVACDARCDLAWGRNTRPRDEHDEMMDDTDAVRSWGGPAPADPGTTEGRDSKPRTADRRLNKWCVRECERAWVSPLGHPDAAPELPFSAPATIARS